MDSLIPPTRFIPFRKSDLVEMCLSQNTLTKEDRQLFRRLSGQLTRLIHASFHHETETLKESFSRISPDSDTQMVDLPTTMSVNRGLPAFSKQLEALLEKANYERIDQAILNQALTQSSLFKLNLHVDFDDFAEVLVYVRGEEMVEEEISTFFGLKKTKLTFPKFERVALYLRLNEQLDEARQNELGLEPGSVTLKLFKDVPRADMEMLFPNTEIRMRTIDKLLIGVPALISGGIVVSTKLGGSLILIGSLIGFWLGLHQAEVELDNAALLALMAGIGALGSYLFKQFNNFKNRKLRFVQSLTKNLYFKNLDNNSGVFHHVIDDAEEEECKEVILAYYFLLASDAPMAVEQLDRHIERWIREQWHTEIDFEIEDAMNKLAQLGLAVEDGKGTFIALPLDKAKRQLDLLWLKLGSGNELMN
jgi:hypothetical protein